MKTNSLLEEIRRLNRTFLQKINRGPTLEESVSIIAEITGFSLLVADNKGVVLAGSIAPEKEDALFSALIDKGSFTGNSGLKKAVAVDEPQHDYALTPAAKNKKAGAKETKQVDFLSVIPVYGNGKRLGTIIFNQFDSNLTEKQVIVSEMAAAMISVILLQELASHEEQDARDKELAEVAFDSLSYSEVEAVREILSNLKENESVIVASKIADDLGITRSVIVNALRKFESAGIIESRSLGMKGTFIRVKNRHALDLVATRSAKMASFF
ncbi:MAG: HTH domain-containing protein [Bacillota bacterium]|nr:HTH domain-containing protein [Bacillota bacterium]